MNVDFGIFSNNGGNIYVNFMFRSYNVINVFFGMNFIQVKFCFKVEWLSNVGGNDGVMYGWFVDDIVIVEGNLNDLKLIDVFWLLIGIMGVVYIKFLCEQVGIVEILVIGFVENVVFGLQNVVFMVIVFGYLVFGIGMIVGFFNDFIVVLLIYVIFQVVGVNNIIVMVIFFNNMFFNISDDIRIFLFEVINDIMVVDVFMGNVNLFDGYFILWQG